MFYKEAKQVCNISVARNERVLFLAMAVAVAYKPLFQVNYCTGLLNEKYTSVTAPPMIKDKLC